MQGGLSCVCMCVKSGSTKADVCNRFSAEAKTASKFAEHRSSSVRHRASRSQESLNDFTFRFNTFAASSDSSTKKALLPSNQSTGLEGPRSSPRSKRALSSRRLCVRPTCWAGPLDAGLWPNYVNISSRRGLLTLLVWRRFGKFCEAVKFGCDAQRRGRNATTHAFGLKKTDSQIRKDAGGGWPDSCLRRVRTAGGSPSSWSVLVSKTGSPACDVYKTLWCAALAGVLRRSRRQAVGIHPRTKTASRDAWCLETSSQKVSRLSANPSDTGQLFAAPQGRRETVLPEEQCPYDLDADERVMAQSD